MNKPSIYGPLMRALWVLQQIEDNGGELTQELAESYKLTGERVSERAESLLELRAAADMLKAEAAKKIEHEKLVMAAQDNAISLIDKMLKSGVELMKAPIMAGTYKLSLRTSEAVIITDDAQILDLYRKPIVVPKTPEKGEPDKALIKQAINKGELVAGAYLDKRTNLQIK